MVATYSLPWAQQGDHTRTFHGGIEAAIAASLRAARIKSQGGAQTTLPYKGIFNRPIHATDEDPTADEATKQPLCDIIADFMVDLVSADASGTMDGALFSTVLNFA